MKRSLIPFIALIVFSGTCVYAELHDRGSGLIYDDVLNITCLQDANYAATETFSVEGISTSGEMDWYTALEWIEAMNQAKFKGYSDWRLPKTLPVNGSYYNWDGSQYDGKRRWTKHKCTR